MWEDAVLKPENVRPLDLPREQVKAELDDLVARTLGLVDEHLPEVETARAREVWSLLAQPSDAPP